MAVSRRVAKEFGYSEEAIDYCWENGMSAGALVDKLWDLDCGGLMENKYPFPIYGGVGLTEAARLKMEEETLHLRFGQVCVICQRQKRSVLYLPCTHLLSCAECVGSSCQVCQTEVIEKVRIFRW